MLACGAKGAKGAKDGALTMTGGVSWLWLLPAACLQTGRPKVLFELEGLTQQRNTTRRAGSRSRVADKFLNAVLANNLPQLSTVVCTR